MTNAAATDGVVGGMTPARHRKGAAAAAASAGGGSSTIAVVVTNSNYDTMNAVDVDVSVSSSTPLLDGEASTTTATLPLTSNSSITALLPVVSNDNDNHPGHNHNSSVMGHGTCGRWTRMMLSPLTDDKGRCGSVVAGLLSIAVVGTLLGLALPKNPTLPSAVERTVSSCIGYTYFIAWSVSFYPQVLTNYRRQSTVGLSADFGCLNLLGFACYATYTLCLFSSHTIRHMYTIKYGPHAEITVQSNDVAFAIHAFILCLITVLQILYYNYYKHRHRHDDHHHNHHASPSTNTKPSPLILSIICILLVIILTCPLLILFQVYVSETSWLDYLYLLSYVKVFISTIKYMPQVVLNYRRKSTMGWSIWQILLDFTGGILSDLQLILDSWSSLHNFSGITGNPAKFLLGFISIFFDIIFMTQHYILYPGAQQQRQSPNAMASNEVSAAPPSYEDLTAALIPPASPSFGQSSATAAAAAAATNPEEDRVV